MYCIGLLQRPQTIFHHLKKGKEITQSPFNLKHLNYVQGSQNEVGGGAIWSFKTFELNVCKSNSMRALRFAIS